MLFVDFLNLLENNRHVKQAGLIIVYFLLLKQIAPVKQTRDLNWLQV